MWVNGEEKQFTTKEFDLLTFLAENPNHVFTKEAAPKMSKWGQKAPPQFRHDKIRIEVRIKVGAESAPKITKWGQKAPPKFRFLTPR